MAICKYPLQTRQGHGDHSGYTELLQRRLYPLEWATAAENTNYGGRTARAAAKNGSKTPVLQIQPGTLNVIAEYPGQSEASRETGIRVSCINACLRGRQHRAGGFIWRYKYKKVVL